MPDSTLATGNAEIRESVLSLGGFARASIEICVYGLILNGALAQIEMVLTGGQVPIPNSIARLGLGLVFGVMLLIYGGTFTASNLAGVYVGFLIYLAAAWIYLTQVSNAAMGEALYGYWLSFSPLLLIFGASLIRPALSARVVIRWLYLLSIVVAGIAVLQFVTNSAILPTSSADGLFQVTQATSSNGSVIRPFSLFASSLDLGIFAAFMGSLAIATHQQGLNRISQMGLVLAFIGLCLITTNRTTYIMCAFAIASAFLIKRSHRGGFIKWLPLAGIAASFILLIPVLIGSGIVGAGISDPKSILARLQEWRYFSQQLFSFGDLIFGKGMVQGGKAGSLVSIVPVDNVFISLFLQIGLGGVIVVSLLYAAIWRELLSRASWQRPLSVAAAAVWAAVPLGGMTNLVLTSCAGYCLLEFCCLDSEWRNPQLAQVQQRTI